MKKKTKKKWVKKFIKRVIKNAKKENKTNKIDKKPVTEPALAIDDQCTHCNGTGQIRDKDGALIMDCHHCHGTGHTGEDKTPVNFSGGAFEFPKKNKDYEDYKQVWEKWWKPLLELKEDIPDDVKKELADYAFILDQVPTVYCAITQNRLSKPNYPASTIIAEYEEDLRVNYLCRDDIESIVNDDNLTDEEKVQEIIKYMY